MRTFRLILILILVAAGQLTWLSELTVMTVTPNLILAGLLALAICRKEDKNYWWVLVFALLWDLLAGRPFGVFTLSACLMFFSAELLAGIIFKQNNFLALLLLAAVGLIFFEFYQFLSIRALAAWQLIESASLPPFYFYAILPTQIFYNGILTLICVWVFRKSHLLNIHG